MKSITWLLSSSTLALALLASCDTAKPVTDAAATPDTSGSPAGAQADPSLANGGMGTMERNGLRLTPFDNSPKFPTAGLRLRNPVAGASQPSGEVPFDYEISNFQLTKMTGGARMEEMANSMQGQHIHNIVDNEPYTAHYDTKFTKPMADGSHAVLSFLSRSYHESLKHQGAYDLRIVNVGQAAAAPPIDVTKPMMFYSRPKGEYKGADTKKIMLDFYLVNTTIEPGGNQVRATINGTEFMLDRWLPYQMEGLPAGDNTIKLELLDAAGNLMPGAYNSVTRHITVTP